MHATDENLLPDRVSIGEKMAYGAGDAASSFYWKTFEFFLVFYYTDVFGLSPGSVATMLLTTRIGDAISDPFMGIVADRTRTRWGRFRPYLLWFSIPLALSAVLTFTAPHFGARTKLVYAYITYSALMLTYTAVNIPYTALMGVLSASSEQRTSTSSWRFALAFLATVFVQKYTISLVKIFGHGNDEQGWQRTMCFYGFLAVLMLLVCFANTRERVASLNEQKIAIRESLRLVLMSRSWRLLFLAVALILAGYAARGAASAYYFKYYLHREDMLGDFLVANGISVLAGIVATPTLAKFFGKKKAMIICCISGALVFSALWAVHPESLLIVFVIQVVSSLLVAPIAPLFFAMFADVADESAWKTSKRQTGLFYASALFAVKTGAAIGGGILGAVLSMSGYVANVAQSDLSLRGIVFSMSVLPGGLLALAGALLVRYDLTESRLASIENDLRARLSERPA